MAKYDIGGKTYTANSFRDALSDYQYDLEEGMVGGEGQARPNPTMLAALEEGIDFTAPNMMGGMSTDEWRRRGGDASPEEQGYAEFLKMKETGAKNLGISLGIDVEGDKFKDAGVSPVVAMKMVQLASNHLRNDPEMAKKYGFWDYTANAPDGYGEPEGEIDWQMPGYQTFLESNPISEAKIKRTLRSLAAGQGGFDEAERKALRILAGDPADAPADVQKPVAKRPDTGVTSGQEISLQPGSITGGVGTMALDPTIVWEDSSNPTVGWENLHALLNVNPDGVREARNLLKVHGNFLPSSQRASGALWDSEDMRNIAESLKRSGLARSYNSEVYRIFDYIANRDPQKTLTQNAANFRNPGSPAPSKSPEFAQGSSYFPDPELSYGQNVADWIGDEMRFGAPGTGQGFNQQIVPNFLGQEVLGDIPYGDAPWDYGPPGGGPDGTTVPTATPKGPLPDPNPQGPDDGYGDMGSGDPYASITGGDMATGDMQSILSPWEQTQKFIQGFGNVTNPGINRWLGEQTKYFSPSLRYAMQRPFGMDPGQTDTVSGTSTPFADWLPQNFGGALSPQNLQGQLQNFTSLIGQGQNPLTDLLENQGAQNITSRYAPTIQAAMMPRLAAVAPFFRQALQAQGLRRGNEMLLANPQSYANAGQVLQGLQGLGGFF